jgi:hypothetical protein
MNLGMPLLLALVAVAAAAIAGPMRGATAAAPEGMVAVDSRKLDELYVRPDAALSGYRRVIVDPAAVALKANWLRDLNATRDVTRRLVPEDAQNIVAEAASIMTSAVAREFAERGYEIVAAPGPGVLRLTPSVSDLDVYAPDVPSPGRQAYFTQDAAGEATLHMEMRDSVAGTLLVTIVDRGTAREVGRMNRTVGASNRFWFDGMFRKWAGNCVAAIGDVQAVR